MMKEKRIFLLIIASGFLLNLSLAYGEKKAIDNLYSWLDSFNSMSGNFVQTYSNSPDGMEIKSVGEFSILKPTYLMWHVTNPDNQLLVSDDMLI